MFQKYCKGGLEVWNQEKICLKGQNWFTGTQKKDDEYAD